MKKHVAEAVHAHHGDNHVVGVRSLRVLLTSDESGWFAQGLEIDYAACGQSIDEAKRNFEDGLYATVREHLIMHGGIKKFLKPASPDAWNEFYTAPMADVKQTFSCLQLHALQGKEKQLPGFPFEDIAFIEPAGRPEAAAAA